METKINIAKILKYKSKCTKLYSSIFGEMTFDKIYKELDVNFIFVKNKDGDIISFESDGKYNVNGECVLFPSKEMRDWHKFAWKKGDVLVNSRGLKILFDRWANDNYTIFYAKTINLVEDGFLDTNLHTLASEKEAKSFIKCIEEKLGGKLNRETLKIEKAQPEFKDGDIVYSEEDEEHYPSISILNIDNKDGKCCYLWYPIKRRRTIIYNVPFFDDEVNRLRYATDEEKQKLFDALAKEGKRWNAEKKVIENLTSKREFKPFDKVVVFDTTKKEWKCDIFSNKTKDAIGNVCALCIGGVYYNILPYEGNESLLSSSLRLEH